MGPEATQFKKGNPGGPGRPPLPPEIKAMEPLTREKYNRILHKYTAMTAEQLKAAASNPQTTVLELIVANIAAKAIQQGDQSRLEALLARAIGPVKLEVEHNLNSVTNVNVLNINADVKSLSDDELKEKVKRLLGEQNDQATNRSSDQ